MSTRRLALLLALAPALALTSACDKEGAEPVDSVGDEIADGDEAEDEDEEEEESDGDTSSEPPKSKPAAAVLCDPEEGWAGAACTTKGGEEGVSYCLVVDGEEFDTPCLVDPGCDPSWSYDYGCMGSICYWDGDGFATYSWSEPDCATPLVVNFDGSPLAFEPAAAATFDIAATGECLSTDWPTLPWLALDRDGDGTITDGRELFGSGTRLASGDRASDGFQALAELDADRDGMITAADPVFAELVLWSDHDGDRRGDLRELMPVESVDLVAIHLGARRTSECDARGNCGGLRSAFEFRGASGELERGEVIDVFLSCQ